MLELRGALRHHPLELLALVLQRKVHAHAGAQHRGVDRLHHVINRAHLQALDLRLRVGLAGEKDDRDVRGERFAFERPAHLEARHLGHLDVEQDQVRMGVGEGFFDRRARVGCGVHFVVRAQRLGHECEQVGGVVDGEDARALFGAHSRIYSGAV